MSRDISNSDDQIDSRDVIARIAELRDERELLVDHLQEAEDEFAEAIGGLAYDVVNAAAIEADAKLVILEGKILERRAILGEWDQSGEGDELRALEALAEEADDYASDWKYGAQLVRDSYFKEYAQELAEDIGLIQRDAVWPNSCIDWDQAALELQMDYTAVDFDGVTYWVR
jgi:hypothetical protein